MEAGMAQMFCPHCGKQLLLAGQRFCAYCAGDLSILGGSERPAPSSGRELNTSDEPSRADARTRDGDTFDGGAIDIGGPNPRALLEAGAAGLAAIALLLPVATVAVTSSYVSSTASASVSALDLIQHTSWTQWIEFDLIVFGTVAALLVAVARALNRRRWSPTAMLCAFAALVAGYVWLLLEWNSDLSQITSVYSWFGVSVGLSQGVGLWIGLGAGIVGGLLSLADPGSEDLKQQIPLSALDSAPHSPATDSDRQAASPYQPLWTPTHRVANGGMLTWAKPDYSTVAATTLASHLEVAIVDKTEGWALIRTENGWQGWVDAHQLVPLRRSSDGTAE
jgi:hypothetical protein